uniref:RagB/SusD family nutrient uptake outer membrane protein n=1 Tax=uncultured Draconibacterium sp. TaxID=1573823 RepID=UPI003217C86E
MKKIGAIITSLILLLGFNSCDNVLEIEDLENYNADQLWSDAKQAEAYITNLYSAFGNWDTRADLNSQQLAGIYWYDNRVNSTNNNEKAWDYERIRLINEALDELDKGELEEDVRNNIKGQALFLRAYVYFNMVKYHGGVPYIKVPQDRHMDDLYVSRNSSEECFEFMVQDLDEAISYLPESISKNSDDYGKIDASFAKAFKAKVLLYKASPQFNPGNPYGNQFWQEAYTAAKTAYDDLKASGYDLVDDYSDIALDEGNDETIFAVINMDPDKNAAWDRHVRPGSQSRSPANAVPTWEFVKEFPMKDGKLYNDPTGAYYKTDEEFLQGFWENRDPRFNKSIVWNGKVYELGGQVGRRQYTALGIADELDDFGINPNASVNSTNLDRYTGFFILKNSLVNLTQAEVLQYDVDFVVMRFAEVMFNYAEAANETGKTDVALEILKTIRERAGIEAGSDNNYGIAAVSREDVREAILAEKNIEFCFEGHRFWDLRRHRLLYRLHNTTKHGVEAIAINVDGSEMAMGEAITKAGMYELTEVNFKYSLLQVPRSGVKVSTLPDELYFFPIKQSSIDKNNNLEQNADWGGSFDPTIN